VSLFIVVKIAEYSFNCGRHLAKSAVSAADKLLDCKVVSSALLKISKYCCALISAIQRSIICFISARLLSLPNILSF
jgi:hypothetical protein